MNKRFFLMAVIALMAAIAFGQESRPRQISVNGETNNVTEGATVQRSVALAAAPSDNVTVKVMSSDDERLEVSTGAVLVFTPENWDQPQNVVLSAVNDYICNGDAEITVTYFSTSKDKSFSECKRQQKLTVADNNTAAVSVTPNPLEINKMTKQGSLFVRLKAQPISDVKVVLRSNNPAVSIPASVLTFSPLNWNVIQKVNVLLVEQISAVEDIFIEIETSSESASYSGLKQSNGIRLVGAEAEKERLQAEENARLKRLAEEEALNGGKKEKKEKELTPEQLKKQKEKEKAAQKKEAEKQKAAKKKEAAKKKAEAKKAAEQKKKEAAKKKAAAKKH